MTWFNGLFGPARREDELHFCCNLCGRRCVSPMEKLTREERTCRCGSTVRQRALVHVLSLELFGESLPLPDFPCRPDIVGVDMSGAATYAGRLEKKLGFTNTFLHKTPKLDIANPDPAWIGRCDFVISSDVFEHVPPPVSIAFINVMRLLKPGGLFVLTVPYTKQGTTVEHFPELLDYQIEMRNGKRVLVNVTRDKHRQEFDNLIFHGGEGETLEMRVFSESGLLDEMHGAGFTDVRIHGESCLEHGVWWADDWSLPITARRAGP
jgi:SAM-dependent methyltransferase